LPASYTHRRFGQEVLQRLPWDIRECINKYRELYDIGLHGPDILFFHDPGVPNGICKLGSSCHKKSGKVIFSEAYQVLQSHDFSPLYQAYVYGYLCHFALDCMCHGYVDKYIAGSGAGHHEIETEFDRMLMVEDGIDPLTFNVVGHLVPSMRNAAVVSAFYSGTKPRDIQFSIHSMSYLLNLLKSSDKKKKALFSAGFRLIRKKDFDGLIMGSEPNPKCQDSNRRLLELYKLAIPLAVRLISEYSRTMEGKLPFDSHYQLNFKSELVPEN
jgi:hypothetical protein